ncbi:hypothetical protein NEOLEDRAFT_920895 [Neolentinus lepideus HHB14362 ss-1]|uniref:Uncharacterized protein n=1 Tax=Neolentinus lepideus HHB14362 ss-1 TaxID=1314782 RepID=A0A165NP00_9AGAM|nr:hypothetical protein NEOLEDRAFT_920895 [Neolentinus lepideus HHB14362 ss-1]
MEGVRRTDDPLSPVLPPKDRDTRTSSNLIVPTSLVPSSPPGRNFSSIRYEQSLSSPAGTDLAFMRSLERPNSQHSADYIPHERTDGNFTSMGNLGRTQFQCLAGPSPHATTGGNIISMQNLGHAQSQRSVGHMSLLYDVMAHSDCIQSPLELMDPLPNPHDTPSSATSTHASNSLLYGSSTRRTSTLHEDMTMYQKKLEMHDQEEAQIAREAQVDPPPQYGA